MKQDTLTVKCRVYDASAFCILYAANEKPQKLPSRNIKRYPVVWGEKENLRIQTKTKYILAV